MNLRNPIRILSLNLLVVSLGYGLVLPIMPFYIESLGAGGRELGWLTATYALMQTICAPFWGILSDRIGRKPVLCLGMMGYAVTLFLFGLATEFWVLFIARTLSGMLSSATMAAAMAFIGDSASEKERSAGMGQLGAAMGVGVIIGPLVGGLLSDNSLSLSFNSAANSLGKVLGPLSAGYLYEMNIECPYISGTGVSILGLLVYIVWLSITKKAV